MIDVDKMRAAYATTPLCQHEWTKKEGNNPTMLCAISALVSFAGVQPDLIHKMNETLGAERWLRQFGGPVLQTEYGMGFDIVGKIPALFDKQENEWRGVQAVLDLCERSNMDERHEEALDEDFERFPQCGPATSDAMPTWMQHHNAWTHVDMYGTPATSFVAWVKETFPMPKSEPAPAPSFGGLVSSIFHKFVAGEQAEDEYWKKGGPSKALWSAHVEQGILAELTAPKFLYLPSESDLKSLAVGKL